MYSFVRFTFKNGFADQVREAHPEWISEFASIVKKQAIYSNVVGENVEAAIKEEDFDIRIEKLTDELNNFFGTEDIWENITMYVKLLTTIRIILNREWLNELKCPEQFVHAFAESLRKMEDISYLKHSPVHIDLQVISGKEKELMQAIEDFYQEYLKMGDPYSSMELEVTETEAAKRIDEYIKEYREISIVKMFEALEKLVITKDGCEVDGDMFSAALEFANRKHAGQKRKDFTPYILHPVRVALYLQKEGYDIRYQIVGLFHDLLEDTDATEQELKRFCDDEMLEAIRLVTKDNTSKGVEYIQRILTHPMAKAVKNADRIDNLRDLKNSEDTLFIKRYLKDTSQFYYGKFSKELDEMLEGNV